MEVQIKESHSDTNSHFSHGLLAKKQKKTSVGQDVERREHLYAIGRSVNWCSQYGKQCGGSFQN